MLKYSESAVRKNIAPYVSMFGKPTDDFNLGQICMIGHYQTFFLDPAFP